MALMISFTAPDQRRFPLTDQHPASKSVCVSVQLGVSVRKSSGIVHFAPADSEDMQDAQVQHGNQLLQLLDSSKCAVRSRPRCFILIYPLYDLNKRSSRNLGSDGCALSCDRSLPPPEQDAELGCWRTAGWNCVFSLWLSSFSLSLSLALSLSKLSRNDPFRYFNSAPLRHQ